MTIRSRRTLSWSYGLGFTFVGLAVFLGSLWVYLSYHDEKLDSHYGSLVFMGLSSISIFTGIFCLFGSQTIIAGDDRVTKELRLFGVKLGGFGTDYDDVVKIQLVDQSDIRIMMVDDETFCIDGLDDDQFYRLSMFLADKTDVPIEE